MDCVFREVLESKLFIVIGSFHSLSWSYFVSDTKLLMAEFSH